MEAMMKMEGRGPPHEQVMEELLRGRKFTNELKDLLLLINGSSNSEYLLHQNHRRENDLLAKILYSFKRSISILTHHRQRHRIEDSADSLRSTSACKIRSRGSYKPRKGSSDSWTRGHCTPNIDDGHSWRKYGQKTIHGYKHHRSYYRCTHKFEQRCPATKQVQQIEDQPDAKYITTFFGHHTCSRPINLVLKHDHDDHPMEYYYTSNSDQSTADSTSKIMLSFANPSTSDHDPAAATIISGTSDNSTTNNFNMMMMMMTNTPQQQQQTSFFSSVGANSSTAAAAAATGSQDYDHLLPSDPDLTFESALTNLDHHHQVDEFDDADVFGCVF